MPAPVFIVYATSKGHTRRIADMAADALEADGFAVSVKNVFEARAEELLDFPFFVLGCSTYGQGDLQRDFLPFEIGMDDLDLHGKWGAVFGSGNRRYQYFAEAVDILEAKIKIQGGRLLLSGLKQDMLDGPPDGDEAAAWVTELVASLRAKDETPD